ncbi:phosphonate C-P lyase system protein PhnH [Phenylobacterium sp.]|mgnify:FL=1|jgi:alpha-D-ribose 1-methylphosphonate 5-triphosphate synthase subunit PhnH|uniref:phosphonate C-P lyase system protein PhnH n=1 Tax=Phenylobacterium sp. TaxID=1871053 RepID=UPI000C89B602|nr:phosphonate C-P lyase system protein PhnH [Phenylobacterium sp.]MAK83903.1 phosphonate C-P lyase system protein PhnH [Phenylobacterium sp.]|tara:strand:+ start:18343 stop:18960 length:618 start_codon:yes stop_codon:yes gene_type:complete
MSVATLDLSRIAPAFADPVRESQAVFREVMECVARPGRITRFDRAPQAPNGLSKAAGAVALTLFDFETLVWLDPALADSEAEAWLRFHCGCPLTVKAEDAAFAIVTDMVKAPNLAAFNQGDAKYPDRSTTVILQIASLEGGPVVTLSGPGIRTTTDISPQGLPQDFWTQIETNQAQFQFGVDVLLVAGDQLLALPRTTTAQIKGG